MDRIINMIINQVIRRVVNIGVNKGFSHFAAKSKPGGQSDEADSALSKTSRDTAKRERQAAKLTRRLGR